MSNQLPDLEVYKRQWTSLQGILQALGDTYSPATLWNFPRKQTLHNLVRCLQSFADAQFSFFYNRFGGDGGARTLVESPDFPDQWVLQAILAQVTYDLEVILRAANQRVSGSGDMKQALDTADKLAWKALQPAKDHGLVDGETTVLTYLQKSPAIRIAPYAKMAMVAIPFSATLVKRDFLAAAHEMGHYVYRRGMTPGVPENRQPIYRILSEGALTRPKVVREWREELFADVYGSIVAGPAITLSAQDIAFQASATDFIKNDGVHPQPIIRPDIYTEVLQDSVASLDSRWEAMRAERHDADLLGILASTQEPIHDFIEYGQSLSLLPDPPLQGVRWTEDNAPSSDVEDYFYGEFKTFVSDTQAEDVGVKELEACPANAWEEWIIEEGFFGGELPPEGEIQPGTEEDIKEHVPPQPQGVWLKVALAAGWTTKIHNHGNP